MSEAKNWVNSGKADYTRDASIKNVSTSVGTKSTDPNLRNRNYAVIISQEQDFTGGPPNIVVGSVSKDLQLQQSVQWATPFGAGLAGSGLVGDVLAAVRGNRLVGQVMTMQVWQGSGGDFDFTVDFELHAWSDPVLDVLDPLKILLKMSLPSVTPTGFLRSPGPILSDEGVAAVSGVITSVAANAITAGSNAATASRTSDGGKSWVGSSIDAVSATAESLGNSGIAKKRLIENHLKNMISIQIGRWFYMRNVIVTNVAHTLKSQTTERKTGIIQSAAVSIGFRPMFAITSEDVETMLQSNGATMSLR